MTSIFFALSSCLLHIIDTTWKLKSSYLLLSITNQNKEGQLPDPQTTQFTRKILKKIEKQKLHLNLIGVIPLRYINNYILYIYHIYYTIYTVYNYILLYNIKYIRQYIHTTIFIIKMTVIRFSTAVLKTDNCHFYDKNCCVYRLTNILL
jgi:hypothetical protein